MRYTIIGMDNICGLPVAYCMGDNMTHHVVLEGLEKPLEKGSTFEVDKLIPWLELPLGLRLNTEED